MQPALEASPGHVTGQQQTEVVANVAGGLRADVGQHVVEFAKNEK